MRRLVAAFAPVYQETANAKDLAISHAKAATRRRTPKTDDSLELVFQQPASGLVLLLKNDETSQRDRVTSG